MFLRKLLGMRLSPHTLFISLGILLFALLGLLFSIHRSHQQSRKPKKSLRQQLAGDYFNTISHQYNFSSQKKLSELEAQDSLEKAKIDCVLKEYATNFPYEPRTSSTLERFDQLKKRSNCLFAAKAKVRCMN